MSSLCKASPFGIVHSMGCKSGATHYRVSIALTSNQIGIIQVVTDKAVFCLRLVFQLRRVVRRHLRPVSGLEVTKSGSTGRKEVSSHERDIGFLFDCR